MVFIEVCIGSSCHLKGAPEIVELLERAMEENNLKDEIVLSGCFCAGMCNRIGVTIKVNEQAHTGITKEGFREFWNDVVLKAVEEGKGN